MMAQSEMPVNHSRQPGEFKTLWLPALFCLFLLTGEIYLLINNWGSTSGAGSKNSGEPIAQFVSGKNIVRQKTVGTLVWESPVKDMPLYRESAIATMEDSEAVLVFNDQSELIIEPNSLLILEEAPSQLSTGSGKIVARLVKGSIKRKGKSASELFVKLSRSKDAPVVKIKDGGGNSVFRVLYRAHGYEVIVESGTVKVNDEKDLNAGEKIETGEPAEKLPAPRLKKPKVEILKSKPTEKPSSSLWNWFIPSALADESTNVSIRFEWEEIPKASQYQIQISEDPKFGTVLAENKVSGLEFQFQRPAPTEKSFLYFRVAGISKDGTVGEYSEIERIEIKPPAMTALPEAPEPPKKAAKIEKTPQKTAKSIAADPTPKPVSTPAPTVAATPAATPAAPPAVAVTRLQHAPVPTHGNFLVWYGFQYEQRSFKSTSSPQTVSGNGIVPTSLGLEYQYSLQGETYYSASGTFTYEKARATLSDPSDTPFSTTSWQLHFTYGKRFEMGEQYLVWSAGPYLASSRSVVANGLVFESSAKLLPGAMIGLQSDPDGSNDAISWRMRGAVFISGGIGADFLSGARKSLFQSGVFKDLFLGLAAGARIGTVESSWNGTVETGFKL